MKISIPLINQILTQKYCIGELKLSKQNLMNKKIQIGKFDRLYNLTYYGRRLRI